MRERRSGQLVETVIKALLAGEEAGGDARGNLSAAIVASGYGVDIDLRVDYATNPARELIRKYYMIHGVRG